MLRTTRMHKEIAKEQEASRVKQKTRDMDAEILLYPMILYIMLRWTVKFVAMTKLTKN